MTTACIVHGCYASTEHYCMTDGKFCVYALFYEMSRGTNGGRRRQEEATSDKGGYTLSC